MTWVPGYVSFSSFNLVEMPLDYDPDGYLALKAAIEYIYNLVVGGSVPSTNVDVWVTLPSGLQLKVYGVNIIYDFRLPDLKRTVESHYLMGVTYNASLYPGQTFISNMFYSVTASPPIALVKAVDFDYTKMKWSDSGVKDYTLLHGLADVAGITLLASLLAIFIKAGFSALNNILDSLLHAKVDAISAHVTEVSDDVDADVLINTDTNTRVKKLYGGSYV